MKRLMVLTLAAALVCGVAGPAAAGWGHGGDHGGGWGFSSKLPILTASLIPASGGMATSGGAVLVVLSNGQVLLKVRGLAGASGPITDTGSLEIELLVNGAAVPTATFPVPVSGGNADVAGTLPVTAGQTFEITGFRVVDSTGTDLLRAGAKIPTKTQKFSIEGTISNLGGACPALTFDVHGVTVTTDANTKFEDGSCTDLADGTKVEVKGTVQSDGSHLATKVEVDDHNGHGGDD